jgi:hypothetical protein
MPISMLNEENMRRQAYIDDLKRDVQRYQAEIEEGREAGLEPIPCPFGEGSDHCRVCPLLTGECRG